MLDAPLEFALAAVLVLALAAFVVGQAVCDQMSRARFLLGTTFSQIHPAVSATRICLFLTLSAFLALRPILWMLGETLTRLPV